MISQELVRLNDNILNGQNELNGLRIDNERKGSELQRCLDDIKRLQAVMDQEKSKVEMTEEKAKEITYQNESLRN
jgi:uncharacterized protein (DUF3084 family)